MAGECVLAREAFLKIKDIEKDCEKLVEKEKEKLKLKIKEVKKKSDEILKSERDKNFEIYKKAVDEFKVCVDRKTEDFKNRVEALCCELEDKLKENVPKAAEVALSKFLDE